MPITRSTILQGLAGLGVEQRVTVMVHASLRQTGPVIQAMRTTKKRIPKFKTEDEERLFWSKADSSDYIDWAQAKSVKLPKLKPTLKTISLRLPAVLIEDLKILADRQDVPYQSLLKVYLTERIALERSPSKSKSGR